MTTEAARTVAEQSTKAAAAPVIRLEGVTKRYATKKGKADDGTLAVRGVDLEVRESEFVSLVGPSGCGKTTLLKLCAGLLPTTEGRVLWRDRGLNSLGQYGMMVFQSPALLPWRSVLNNVLFPATIMKMRTADLQERAVEALRRVQLRDVEDSYPDELSGGMQQRVAIARALVTDPEVLFMDEPFGALDAMTREELNVMLQSVHIEEQKTVLFVTHNIQEAVFLSDRVVVMGTDPGHIKTTFDVPIARPRSLKDMLKPEFRELEELVRSQLDALGE